MKKSRQELAVEWSEKIDRQIQSGKSIAAWCKEQAISYNTFLYWYNKLQKSASSQDQEKAFIECPQDSELWMEIHLEGAKLILSKNFNRASLLFCLRVFGGH